jgi:glycosyltransferase involved in cell wall biosynthesis
VNARTILVDLRGCQFNGDRGIPAYAQSLALELTRGHPRHRWLLLRDDRWPPPNRAAELAAHAAWCTAADLDGRSAPAIDDVLTGCFFLPHHGCGADYLLPGWLRRQAPRRLGIVYDVVPLLFPERYLARDRTRRQYLDSLGVLRSSDGLFTISHATRRDTIRHAAVDPLRVTCIYGDIDHAKRGLAALPSAATADVPARHGLTGPFCVYVGGDDWRKNMETAVRAFALFWQRHADHQLAVVCKLSAARIAELREVATAAGLPATAVVFTGFVSDEDLVGLVRHATLLVYPSLYEGLGLPVLEAYACGTPVVGSDTSSIAELVLPELACDPRQPEAIAAAMGRLAASPALRERSLAFGRRLLADELGWARAAERVMERIERPRAVRGSPPVSGPRPAETSTSTKPRVAVVAALPPARTGIAPYTLEHLQHDRWQTTFYEASPAARVAPQQGLLAGNRVVPAEAFAAAAARGRHDAAIFVLGNSAHHAKVLDAVMASRGTSPRRLAYLHEAALEALCKAWLGEAWLDGASPSPSANASLPDWMIRALAAKPALAPCLRLLVERGEFDGVLVNSAACRDLIRLVLGPRADGLPIDVVHLPVDMTLAPSPAMARPRAAGPLRIGSFGMAGDTKRLDVLARAVASLRRRRPVTLVIAGWEARRGCRRLGLVADGLEILDGPDDDALLVAMRSVDVAVQLRSPTFGESSGVVNQLLALGRPLVVTGEGSFTELPAEIASFVAADCPPADLAAAIEAAACRTLSPQRHREILAARSAEAFAARMAEILAARPATPGGIRPAAIATTAAA